MYPDRGVFASLEDALAVARGLTRTSEMFDVASCPTVGFLVLSEYEAIPSESADWQDWLTENGIVYLPPRYEPAPALDAVREEQLGVAEEERQYWPSE